MPIANLKDFKMMYDDTGKGFPFVLLHGFPFNRSMWREQADAFTPQFRVVTPDLRGFGESINPAGDEVSIEGMAQDVAALMDELAIKRAVIGGLSMGGYVALAFYRQFPFRAQGLVLANTRPQGDTDETKEIRKQQIESIRRDGIEAVIDTLMTKLLSAKVCEQQPHLVNRVGEMIATTSADGAASALSAMAERRNYTSLLQRIMAPALIIAGSEDQIISPDDAERMHSEIRGSRLAIIEGAGHISNMEDPVVFNDVTLKFLATLLP